MVPVAAAQPVPTAGELDQPGQLGQLIDHVPLAGREGWRKRGVRGGKREQQRMMKPGPEPGLCLSY